MYLVTFAIQNIEIQAFIELIDSLVLELRAIQVSLKFDCQNTSHRTADNYHQFVDENNVKQ